MARSSSSAINPRDQAIAHLEELGEIYDLMVASSRCFDQGLSALHSQSIPSRVIR
jgi:hypothetical protein